MFEADDGRKIHVSRWLPDGSNPPARGFVHISHGMAEHGARYARVAEALTRSGWAVYADDHRGHGKTARWSSELGYLEGGMRRAVRDLEELIAHEKEQHPGRPAVVMGHSFGSYIVQAFLAEHGAMVDAAILSGTSGKPNALATAGRAIARAERRRLGDRGKSRLLTELSFGGFNKAFKPNRTEFDWLSRDEAEVDRYIADPHCGFMVTTSFWVEVLDALVELSRPELQARIPRDLPIYILAGARDPVGDNGKGVKQLVGAYHAAGLRRVTHRLYEGGRHEMVNETNRDEVIRDLMGWLEEAAPRRK